MNAYHKKMLRNISFVIVIIFIIINYVVYKAFSNYLIVENQSKVKDLLMHNKALHSYVEFTLKPVIYKLQEEGRLDYSYFDPKILSFTYISRHIMQEYNKERDKQNLPRYIYKIASDNPRNPINRASKQELALLKKFNDTNTTFFTKNITLHEKKYIYYAMPVKRSGTSCMRCHSSPEVAPKELVQMYGPKAGFDEKIGESRALISLTIPLAEDMKSMQYLYRYFVGILTVIFIVIIIIIYFFIKQLDAKDKKLLDKIKHDGLTNIYNRYKFNKDNEKLINSKRYETLY